MEALRRTDRCTECGGECCSKYRIFLNNKDTQSIASHLDLRIEDFQDLFLDRGLKFRVKVIDGKQWCPFFNVENPSKGCLIDEVKPAICARFICTKAKELHKKQSALDLKINQQEAEKIIKDKEFVYVEYDNIGTSTEVDSIIKSLKAKPVLNHDGTFYKTPRGSIFISWTESTATKVGVGKEFRDFIHGIFVSADIKKLKQRFPLGRTKLPFNIKKDPSGAADPNTMKELVQVYLNSLPKQQQSDRSKRLLSFFTKNSFYPAELPLDALKALCAFTQYEKIAGQLWDDLHKRHWQNLPTSHAPDREIDDFQENIVDVFFKSFLRKAHNSEDRELREAAIASSAEGWNFHAYASYPKHTHWTNQLVNIIRDNYKIWLKGDYRELSDTVHECRQKGFKKLKQEIEDMLDKDRRWATDFLNDVIERQKRELEDQLIHEEKSYGDKGEFGDFEDYIKQQWEFFNEGVRKAKESLKETNDPQNFMDNYFSPKGDIMDLVELGQMKQDLETDFSYFK